MLLESIIPNTFVLPVAINELAPTGMKLTAPKE
jgi:hypothetical protein